MDVCVHIARATNYTIEQVLDHSLGWVKAMIYEISRQEFEDNLTQLAIHGAKKDDIERARRQYSEPIEANKKAGVFNVPSVNQFPKGLKVIKVNKKG